MMPPGKHTTTEALRDSLITSKIKMKLNSSSDIDTHDVRVETFKGTVQLSGFVETIEIHDVALDLVNHVDGVLQIEDLLDVRTIQQ
jgi:osmotically-inducible protein OsmY